MEQQTLRHRGGACSPRALTALCRLRGISYSQQGADSDKNPRVTWIRGHRAWKGQLAEACAGSCALLTLGQAPRCSHPAREGQRRPPLKERQVNTTPSGERLKPQGRRKGSKSSPRAGGQRRAEDRAPRVPTAPSYVHRLRVYPSPATQRPKPPRRPRRGGWKTEQARAHAAGEVLTVKRILNFHVRKG